MRIRTIWLCAIAVMSGAVAGSAGADLSDPHHHAGDSVRARRQHLDRRPRHRRQDEPSCSAKRSWSTTVPAPAAPSAPGRWRRASPTATPFCSSYTGTLAIGPSLYTNAGYDPRKDFAPIGLIGNAPNSLVVHPSFPAKTVAELIAYAKANPGKVNFGSAGAGTVSHITGEYFAAFRRHQAGAYSLQGHRSRR